MRLSLAAVLALAAAPAFGQAPESRYTELVGGRCRFVSVDKETGEDAVKRCPGHGGAEVETFASHTRLSIGFRFSRSQRAEDVVSAWSAGKTVEWRGLKGNKGFEPYAAIVRLLMKDHENGKPGPVADAQVLAVVRVDPREAEACVIAIIDAQANKDPNGLARTTADRLGPAFDCESDKPAVVGTKTRWTGELIGVGKP
ncbi:MAG TPA: hypothetical protein VF744_19400 [Beijerinckiaceae bacterium]|jgi:hypothetical protein